MSGFNTPNTSAQSAKEDRGEGVYFNLDITLPNGDIVSLPWGSLLDEKNAKSANQKALLQQALAALKTKDELVLTLDMKVRVRAAQAAEAANVDLSNAFA